MYSSDNLAMTYNSGYHKQSDHNSNDLKKKVSEHPSNRIAVP